MLLPLLVTPSLTPRTLCSGTYLTVMKELPSASADAFHGMQQLFEVYVYAVAQWTLPSAAKTALGTLRPVDMDPMAHDYTAPAIASISKAYVDEAVPTSASAGGLHGDEGSADGTTASTVGNGGGAGAGAGAGAGGGGGGTEHVVGAKGDVPGGAFKPLAELIERVEAVLGSSLEPATDISMDPPLCGMEQRCVCGCCVSHVTSGVPLTKGIALR